MPFAILKLLAVVKMHPTIRMFTYCRFFSIPPPKRGFFHFAVLLRLSLKTPGWCIHNWHPIDKLASLLAIISITIHMSPVVLES